jgi:hypothetical protein
MTDDESTAYGLAARQLALLVDIWRSMKRSVADARADAGGDDADAASRRNEILQLSSDTKSGSAAAAAAATSAVPTLTAGEISKLTLGRIREYIFCVLRCCSHTHVNVEQLRRVVAQLEALSERMSALVTRWREQRAEQQRQRDQLRIHGDERYQAWAAERQRNAQAYGEQLQSVLNEIVCLMADVQGFASEGDECNICMDMLAPGALQTPCKHVFCKPCIVAWLQTSPKCPMCREPVPNPKDLKLANLRANSNVSSSSNSNSSNSSSAVDEDVVMRSAEEEAKDNNNNNKAVSFLPLRPLRPGQALEDTKDRLVAPRTHVARRLPGDMCAKLEYLVARLRHDRAGTKMVVCVVFPATLRAIEERLGQERIAFAAAKGSQNGLEADQALVRFHKESNVKVFLTTPRVGGKGLSLTCASTLVFFDPPANVVDDVQTCLRLDRINQTQAVTVERWIMADSMDERLAVRNEHLRKFVRGDAAAAAAGGDTSATSARVCELSVENRHRGLNLASLPRGSGSGGNVDSKGLDALRAQAAMHFGQALVELDTEGTGAIVHDRKRTKRPRKSDRTRGQFTSKDIDYFIPPLSR